MLKVKNLTVGFKNGPSIVEVLKGFDVSLDAGEIVAVVGESGAGKSTAGAAIGGRLPLGGRILSGSIDFHGRRLDEISQKEFDRLRGTQIGSIFQDPLSALNPLESAGRQLIETLTIKGGESRRGARIRAIELLQRVGFDDPASILERYPHELSGGMLQRVVVAIALSCNPSLVIADEPTTALDVSLRNGIIDLLREAATTSKVGIILITHDISVVRAAADRVYILRQGELVESGDTEKVLSNPQHGYARRLISSVPPSTGKLKRLQNKPFTTFKGDTFAKSQHNAIEPVGVELQGVSVLYPNKDAGVLKKATYFKALNDASFSVPKGKILGIIGSSGSGKTTAARLIAGLAQPTSGKIIPVFDDENELNTVRQTTNAHSKPSRSNRPSVQMIFQNPFASLNPRHSILKQLTDAPIKVGGKSTVDAKQQAVTLIEAVGLSRSDLNRYPHSFSGGQLQRISIARALSMHPSILICDEPTSALDVTIQAFIVDMLKDLNEALGTTIIFVSHDLTVCRHLCDTIVVMNRGEVCEKGPTLDVLDRPKHPFTQTLVANSKSPLKVSGQSVVREEGNGGALLESQNETAQVSHSGTAGSSVSHVEVK
ncbi:MAG: ABC transporter ATP-binding protein [Pseudomonadota bacterium]